MLQRLLAVSILIGCIAAGFSMSLRRIQAQGGAPDIIVEYDQVVSESPPAYGTNIWWSDQDAAMWQTRQEGLHLNIVRFPISHFGLEPINDDGDPNTINWDGFHFEQAVPIIESQPHAITRTITYSNLFAMLRDQPDVTLLIYPPYLAPWLSDNPPHPIGPSPFPPNDLAEYQEFIKVVLRYMIEQVGIPPERILFEAMNEPDLNCGADPVTFCFWDNWNNDDVADVVSATHRAILAVNSNVRLVGVAECCGTNVVRNLLNNTPEGAYLDGLSYHYYDSTSLNLSPALSRANELASYNLPLYLDEYGNTIHQSEGITGALWHSYALPTWWEAGISPVQYPISEWPTLGEPYNSMGLFEYWANNWTYKPSYWVYANFYRHLGGTRVVSYTAPSALKVTTGRDDSGSGRLAVWVTNPLAAPQSDTLFEIQAFPATQTLVSVYSNTQSITPTTTFTVFGQPLQFSYDIPAQSSLSFVLKPSTGTATLTFIYLPIILKQETLR